MSTYVGVYIRRSSPPSERVFSDGPQVRKKLHFSAHSASRR